MSSSAPADEHECVEEHCPACCPVYQAWENGYASGARVDDYLYHHEAETDWVDILIFGVAFVLVAAVVDALVQREDQHHARRL